MASQSSNPHRWVYRDRRYLALRPRVFRRDNHTCQHCGKLVLHDVPANHPLKGVTDHIVPLSEDIDRAFDLANLQTMHKRCHDISKTRVQRSNRMQRDDGW